MRSAEQRRLSSRWLWAWAGVVVVWLVLGYVTFGLGSFVSNCLAVPSLADGAAYCGEENPSLVLLSVSMALKPLSLAVFATAFILALAYLLGRPRRLAWLLGLFAWTAGLLVMGAIAPQTIVCESGGEFGPYPTCVSAWRPGWEWLVAWLVGTLIVVMASRLVEFRHGAVDRGAAANTR